MANRPFPSFRKGYAADGASLSDVTPDPVNWQNITFRPASGFGPAEFNYQTKQITGIDSPIILKFVLSGLYNLPPMYWALDYKIDTQQPSYSSPTNIQYQGFSQLRNNETIVINNNEYLTFTYSVDMGSINVEIINVTDSNTKIDEFQCLYTD